jgi:8-oxo-dGTP diphosphatase
LAYHRALVTGILPYKIAVLCYLFDEAGRVLLLHRRKAPNQDLYSPIGGKLDMPMGESPTACAVREIHEEAGVRVEASQLHLTGIVSEAGFELQNHWLMFLYELTRPVQIARMSFEEGRLEWHDLAGVESLAIPETDRQVIWPLFRTYRRQFFAAHIDCRGGGLTWHLEQPPTGTGAASGGLGLKTK